MQYVHGQKVVHLDLKTSNVLLTSMSEYDLGCCIFDFAASFDFETIKTIKEDWLSLTTLAYTAPELFQR